MSEAGSLTLRIEHLKSPNQTLRDEAARLICQRFSARLRALVRCRLDIRIRRREDEDDILQTSYASFFAGQKQGRATPASREELWKLLVRITLCKMINTANRHTAARRDVRRENPPRHDHLKPQPTPTFAMLDHLQGSTHAPEEQIIVAEELDFLLRDLPEDLRKIVLWKLEGYTSADIACFIGRTVRMVELKMQIIRKRLEGHAWTLTQDAGESA